MEGNYQVYLGNQPVGKVQVLREGLYYRFICRCRINMEGVYRLSVLCGGKQEPLGVVVPEGDGFGLDKRIPSKRLGQGTPEFYLAPRRDTLPGKLVPISPEEPFAYIARLKDAFLVRQNGGAYACFREG